MPRVSIPRIALLSAIDYLTWTWSSDGGLAIISTFSGILLLPLLAYLLTLSAMRLLGRMRIGRPAAAARAAEPLRGRQRRAAANGPRAAVPVAGGRRRRARRATGRSQGRRGDAADGQPRSGQREEPATGDPRKEPIAA